MPKSLNFDTKLWRLERRSVDRRDMDLTFTFFETRREAFDAMVKYIIQDAKWFRENIDASFEDIVKGRDKEFGKNYPDRDDDLASIKLMIARPLVPSDIDEHLNGFFVPSPNCHAYQHYNMGTNYWIKEWSMAQGIKTDICREEFV